MPVDGTTRHFVGPEQPNAPPHPVTLPPASELIGDPPEDIEDAPEPEPRPAVGDDVRAESFRRWRTMYAEAPVDLEDAFTAGWNAALVHAATHGVRTERVELPLEGTVESRTIIAALELFKDQVLAHNPDEVKSGEWLNARDVDMLIQGIRANAAKGR